MKKYIITASIFAVLCMGAACTSTTTSSKPTVANNSVTVTYVNPEKFTDVKDSSMDNDKVRDDYLQQLKDYIIERASRRLDEGQKLAVTITDVDMAGDFEPWHGPRLQDVRIIKDIYPPRVDLSFVLTGADGKTISEGTRQLRDLNYMMSIPTTLDNSDPLRYEKRLLDSWISNEFSGLKSKK